jgi:hypothetical protein
MLFRFKNSCHRSKACVKTLLRLEGSMEELVQFILSTYREGVQNFGPAKLSQCVEIVREYLHILPVHGHALAPGLYEGRCCLLKKTNERQVWQSVLHNVFWVLVLHCTFRTSVMSKINGWSFYKKSEKMCHFLEIPKQKLYTCHTSMSVQPNYTVYYTILYTLEVVIIFIIFLGYHIFFPSMIGRPHGYFARTLYSGPSW